MVSPYVRGVRSLHVFSSPPGASKSRSILRTLRIFEEGYHSTTDRQWGLTQLGRFPLVLEIQLFREHAFSDATRSLFVSDQPFAISGGQGSIPSCIESRLGALLAPETVARQIVWGTWRRNNGPVAEAERHYQYPRPNGVRHGMPACTGTCSPVGV